MDLSVQNLSKSYKKNLAVDHVSFEVPSGKIYALLGPSGCGKTTILRVIAGLIRPDSGRIFLGGKDITDVPPNERPTVTVFQDYALFPHLNVYDNISYGLKAQHVKRSTIQPRVYDIAAMLSLQELLARKTHQLSGGQQQRVALARALVLNPKVILFDEPLSSLDTSLRLKMRQEIRKIQEQTGVTSIYVTHDQEEAFAIAHQIMVMNSQGQIEQIGDPETIYYHPRTSFVANFMGDSNLIPVTMVENRPEISIIRFWGQELTIDPQLLLREQEQPCLFFRPESVLPDPGGCFSAIIDKKIFLGPVTRYILKQVNGASGEILMDLSHYQQDYREGDKIRFTINTIPPIQSIQSRDGS